MSAQATPRLRFIAAMRRAIVVEVTNHYVTREDHPCYGTTLRTVSKRTGSSFYLLNDDLKSASRIAYPGPSQILEEVGPQGFSWTLLGGGAAQGPTDPYLTIRVVVPS